jgi:hypothetical protein
MHGKCNCGKKATSEFLITDKDSSRTMKFCEKCSPKHRNTFLQLIYGKVLTGFYSKTR